MIQDRIPLSPPKYDKAVYTEIPDRNKHNEYYLRGHIPHPRILNEQIETDYIKDTPEQTIQHIENDLAFRLFERRMGKCPEFLKRKADHGCNTVCYDSRNNVPEPEYIRPQVQKTETG